MFGMFKIDFKQNIYFLKMYKILSFSKMIIEY